jgi:hypothetical protein
MMRKKKSKVFVLKGEPRSLLNADGTPCRCNVLNDLNGLNVLNAVESVKCATRRSSQASSEIRAGSWGRT